jgi:hypothetical protein
MISTVNKPKTTANIPSQVLNSEQIKEKVGNGWALIEDPEYNGCVFLGGKLIFYSHNEDETFDVMSKCKGKRVLIMYCGKRDPNIVYLL